MIDDAFIEAVKNDKDIYLHHPVYNKEGKIENDTVDSKSNGIQYWRLTWNPQKKEGVFTRVRLKVER